MSVNTSVHPAAAPQPPARSWPWRGRVLALLGALLLMLGLVWGERQGWPWLVQPAADLVARLIDRRVDVAGQAQARLHPWGGVRLSAPQWRIGAPAWAPADTPWLLSLHDGELAVGYAALWRMAQGGRIEIERLEARRLQAWLTRLPDGRGSWQLGPQSPAQPPDAAVTEVAKPLWQSVTVRDMALHQGLFNVDDQVLGLQARVSASVVPEAQASAPGDPEHREPSWHWAAVAQGSHRGLPLHMQAHSSLPWRWLTDRELVLEGSVGRARVSYQGPAPDASGAGAGRFSLAGPSLAAVGEAVGITLPTTPAFQMRGALWWHGERTNVRVVQARIGDSRLSGDFTHDRGTTPPSLVGVLRGQRLALADLGPAVGVPVPGDAAQAKASDRVLPDRPFNLPSLRAMDADVRLAIDLFDTGNTALQAMRDLRGRIVLQGLDLMEGLVEFISGDESLPISCAQVRLEARDGVLRPAPAIVTTPDSTLWADGHISLKDETLDLRTRVAPKDFSLLTLRTPVQLSGPWRQVDVKVIHPETWMRILGAAALAVVHPLAGVLPLVDPGQREVARAADLRCRRAMAGKAS